MPPEPSVGRSPAQRLGVALGWAGLAIVGLLALRPELLADLRARGRVVAVADCDPTLPACAVALPDGGIIGLKVAPAGAPAEVPLALTVTASGGGTPQSVSVSGVDMNMGLVEAPLAPTSAGWAAEIRLPACTLAEMRWQIDVSVAPSSVARFAITSRQAPAAAVWDVYDASVAPTRPPFVLQTPSGPVDSRNAPGEVVIVYFGYLSCPDICPTMLATLGAAVSRLSPDEQARVRGVFASLDPERDAIPAISAYASSFHPRFAGGQAPDVGRLAAAWGTASRKVRLEGSAMGYTVDHGTRAYAVGVDGSAAEIPHGAPIDAVVDQLRRALTPP